MEKYGYRFAKPRAGYACIEDFIKNRIFILFQVTFQIAVFHGLNMEKEFQDMIMDATAFLKRFKKENDLLHI